MYFIEVFAIGSRVENGKIRCEDNRHESVVYIELSVTRREAACFKSIFFFFKKHL